MKYNINKSALIEEAVNGAWDRSMHARHQLGVNMNAHMKDAWKNNPGNYLLNPFVPGPVTHLTTVVGNAVNGAVYNALKNKDSSKLSNTPTVVADTTKGAFNSYADTVGAAANEYQNKLNNLSERNPIQYAINPFVAGPVINSAMGGISLGTGIGRVLSSPFSKKGDTLVKAPSGYMK